MVIAVRTVLHSLMSVCISTFQCSCVPRLRACVFGGHGVQSCSLLISKDAEARRRGKSRGWTALDWELTYTRRQALELRLCSCQPGPRYTRLKQR
jgi:hypothetical protein